MGVFYIEGIDVSSYQGEIDWKEAFAYLSAIGTDEKPFAYAKTSEGHTIVDPFSTVNMLGGRRAGFRMGGYHFLVPGNIQAQVDWFLANLDYTEGDLPPWVDTERSKAGSPSATEALEFAQEVEKRLVKPIIYTGPNYATVNRFGTCPELSRYELAIADYSMNLLPCPPWGNKWRFHQYSGKANVPGVPTPCDLDRAVSLP